MQKNTGWIVAIVILSVMLIFSMVVGAPGLNPPAPSSTFTPTVAVLKPTDTPSPTSTPDPCSPKNIDEQVKRVNSLTREFMDTDQILASTLSRDTNIALVQDMQRIRRNAEEQSAPSCLSDLKNYQLGYMNARIDIYSTALAFLNTYGSSGARQKDLNQLLVPLTIKSAVAAHQYENEYARMMGLPTLTPIVLITVTSTP